MLKPYSVVTTPKQLYVHAYVRSKDGISLLCQHTYVYV